MRTPHRLAAPHPPPAAPPASTADQRVLQIALRDAGVAAGAQLMGILASMCSQSVTDLSTAVGSKVCAAVALAQLMRLTSV